MMQLFFLPFCFSFLHAFVDPRPFGCVLKYHDVRGSALYTRHVSFDGSTKKGLSFLQAKDESSSEWFELEPGICKRIIVLGHGNPPLPGQTVTISYVGTIVNSEWSCQEVIDCWLNTLQGQEDLADVFMTHNIDGKYLLQESFDENFVSSKLGISNKIKAKKLTMAAKRLRENVLLYPGETVFDENETYQIVIGKSKVIRGIAIGVSSMMLGEKAQLRIRCDQAYGPDGVRRRNGETMVPPYSTLSFEVTLQSIE